MINIFLEIKTHPRSSNIDVRKHKLRDIVQVLPPSGKNKKINQQKIKIFFYKKKYISFLISVFFLSNIVHPLAIRESHSGWRWHHYTHIHVHKHKLRDIVQVLPPSGKNKKNNQQKIKIFL